MILSGKRSNLLRSSFSTRVSHKPLSRGRHDSRPETSASHRLPFCRGGSGSLSQTREQGFQIRQGAVDCVAPTGSRADLAAVLALSILLVLAGCRGTEGAELLEIDVSPSLVGAKHDAINIGVTVSREVDNRPVVTLGGQDVALDGFQRLEGDAIRYLYRHLIVDTTKDGSVPVVATLVDSDGRESTLESEVVFDFSRPSVTDFEADPDLTITDQTDIVFTFGCSKDGCSFSCSLFALDQGAVVENQSCRSGVAYSDLAQDEYTFSVSATDSLGNTSEEPAVWTWVVGDDAVSPIPPVVSIQSGPDGITNKKDATFEFECSKVGCSFVCTLYDEHMNEEEIDPDCTSPITYRRLDDGEYTFQVVATDILGTPSEPATWLWVIDTAAPVVEFTLVPESKTTSRTVVNLGFECTGKECVSFECAVDRFVDEEWREETLTSCSSIYSRINLPAGLNRARVVGTDNAGNSASVEHEWVVLPSRWKSVSAGGVVIWVVYLAHTCGIEDNGTLWCWGLNNFGQLGVGLNHADCQAGDNGLEYCAHPMQVGSASDWESVSLGGAHTCATKTDGSLWCWGVGRIFSLDEDVSQHSCVEIDEYESCPTPIRVGEDDNWAHVSLGYMHTCGVRHDQTLWCWGDNANGQLGVGLNHSDCEDEVLCRKEIQVPGSWRKVSAGISHTCALDENSSLFCWGSNDAQQLGVNETLYPDRMYATPLQVSDTQDWLTVDAGIERTVAIKQDGSLWFWGRPDTSTPRQIGASSQWLKASADQYHGPVGLNDDGLIQVLSPKSDPGDDEELPELDSESGWVDLDAATAHVCAIKSDRALWCAGSNRIGQLGNGSRSEESWLDWVLVGSTYE